MNVQKRTVTLRELAGALNGVAEKHSRESEQFATLELSELATRSAGRALTLRAAVTELLLMAESEDT